MTLVRSPTMTKFCAALVTSTSPMHEGLEAGEAHLVLDLRHAARRVLRDSVGDGADVLRRGAATAADDVDEAVAAPTRSSSPAMCFGVSSYPPISLGRPALG